MKQRITIIGHLGRDPEMKFTPTGQAVTGFSVATTRKWTQNDEKKSETIWFRIETWGKLAEICNTWLQKGSLVEVVGRLKPIRIYTKQDGTPAAELDIVANEVTFLSGTKSASEKAEAGDAPAADSDIPF